MNQQPLPKRKNQRLPCFDYSTNSRYFLTVCTKDKTKILSKVVVGDIINPAYVVLTDIGKTVERYILSSENMEGIAIENYVIMPNHIHIIVAYTGNDGSSGAPTHTNAIIPRLVSSLKRLVNKEVGHPIWQRGYYDHVIRGEEDYREIWSYIDNNPAHWAEDEYYAS